jgi:hypothetical protein
MIDVNLNPYTAESEAIAKRRRMAELLQEQSLQPLEMPQQPGVPISPYAGLAKILGAYVGSKKEQEAATEQKNLAQQYQKDVATDLSSIFRDMRAPAQAGMVMGDDTMQGARPAGYLDPANLQAMKTPIGQQTYMAQLLAKPEAPTKGSPGDVFFDRSGKEIFRVAEKPEFGTTPQYEKDPNSPTGYVSVLYGKNGERKVVGPANPVNQFTTPTVGRAGNLGVYDEYRKQQEAVGKQPMPIDQFMIEQTKAGRAPAAITYGSPVAAVGPDGKPVFIQPGRGGGAPSVIQGFTPLEEKLKPIPPSVNTAIIQNQTANNQLDRAIALVSGQDLPGMTGDKNATGLKGYLPNAILNRVDPKGVSARAEIADIGSLKLHDRSGAAVTASESPRLMPFIPLATDDNETVLKKLNRLKLEVQNETSAMKDIYSKEQGFKENPILNKPSVVEKITTMQEIQDVATKRGLSVEQVKKDALAKGYKVQ